MQVTAGADSSLTLTTALSDLLRAALRQQQEGAVAAAIHSCPLWLRMALAGTGASHGSDTDMSEGFACPVGATLPAPFLRGEAPSLRLTPLLDFIIHSLYYKSTSACWFSGRRPTLMKRWSRAN